MKPPSRPRVSRDPREAAEAAFRRAPPPLPEPAGSSLPNVRESVTLRIDRDVLEHFQKDGPGWQDRLNAFLRQSLKI